VLLDLPLALEVWDARLPVRAADGAVDIMLDPCRLRRVREPYALPNLSLIPGLEELLDRKDPVDAIEHPLDGRGVLEVPAHDLGPEAGELFRLRFIRVPG